MTLTEMPEHIRSFLDNLLQRGFDVWLIGSYANPTDKPPSDWDFIIFGNKDLLRELSGMSPVAGVDPLIVLDGNAFESPWPRKLGGTTKKGNLSGWKWQQTSDDSATYEGTKLPNDWGTPRNAIRVKV